MSTKVLSESTNMNGSSGKFIENIDPEDPDYRRELQRPADVKEDMRQMESRQRVSSILNSQAFREELESIIADQLKHGPHPASLIALQQISDLLLPNTNSRWQQVSSMGKANIIENGNGNVLIPINDIRGIDTLNYAKGERILRCKLASLYRVIDLYGWTSGIANYVSARLSQDLEQYLVNPYGLLYHEVTASSLIKVNLNDQNVVEQGSTTYGINKAAFSLHSAIYKARPDLKCIVHIHTHSVTAVSSMKCGLLPISQEAIACGNISYHEYKGALNEDDVKRLLAHDLGPLNKVMFLRNHGVVACGETVEEACHHLFNIMAACEIQSRALMGGLDNIFIPSTETQRHLAEAAQNQNESPTLLENKKWKVGELEFEALMRCLDNAGYRTGYMYRQPIMRGIDRNAIKDVEIPPAVTSHCYDMEYIRKLKEEKSKVVKGEWLNSPNVYSRTEQEETGTANPKKITKWLAGSGGSPNKTSTPVRIENKNQFAPQGFDPKELKNQQKQIKQDRMEDKKTPGYQSRLLENIVTIENSAMNGETSSNGGASDYANHNNSSPKLNNTTSTNKDGSMNGNLAEQYLSGMSGQNATIIFGAASKGIIKRDQQHNAGVYKTLYAASNPFQQMDPNELERYKKEVAQKQIREQENIESKQNRSEIITTESKKKSHTIPRSKSLLDKKHDSEKPNQSGGSQTSTPQSSHESSPSSSTQKLNSSQVEQMHMKINGIEKGGQTMSPNQSSNSSPPNAQANKSATIPSSMMSSGLSKEEKKDKPKKKSKLSFLRGSKKSKDKDQSA